MALSKSSSDLDKAIIYNNISRIYLDQGDINLATSNINLCYEAFKDTINIVLKERTLNDKYKLDSFLFNKSQLLAFLLYNYGFVLESVGNVNNSKVIFKRGYEFARSTLGDSHFLTEKFRPKLSNLLKGKIPLKALANTHYQSYLTQGNSRFNQAESSDIESKDSSPVSGINEPLKKPRKNNKSSRNRVILY